MTSSPKPPANNAKPPSGESSSTAVSTPTAGLAQGVSPADQSSPSSAGRDNKASWKDSLRSSHRSTKRRGGGRFLLSQYFHYDAPEKHDRGRSPAAELGSITNGKGKDRASNESGSASRSPEVNKLHKNRTSSAETKSSDDTDEPSMEEGRRSTSMDLDKRRTDRIGQTDQAGSLDASRIVSMALNLSEGRRRNVSGHLVVPSSSSGHRVASAGMPTLHGQYGSGVGGSLRKHLQDQRRISRAFPNESQNSTSNHVSSANYSLPIGSNTEIGDSSSISISHGTISRVEKAKKYIELSAYHRELLDYLPALKPQARYAGPSGNGQFDAYSKHETLGRAYNPLQLIRNRKARVRERIELIPDPPIWDNSQAVKAWLELVEMFSHDDGYVEGEEVVLPSYPTNEFQNLQDDQQGLSPSTSRFKRPRVDWIVSPPELLADAYWLEREQHKSLTEDRNGNKIFPKIWTSNQGDETGGGIQSSNPSSPRYSMGSERARDSDGLSEKRGRDHSGEYPEAHEISGRLKHGWNKARGRSSSTSSGLSYSDDEKGHRIRRVRTQTNSDLENTGPLEKNLNKFIDVRSSNIQSHSPSMISPGTPDKWGTGKHLHLGKSTGDTDVEPMDLDSWKTPEKLNQRREHLFTPENDESNQSSPISNTFVQGGGLTEKAPEGANVQSLKKSRRSLIPFVKGDGQRAEKIPLNWPLNQDKTGRHSDTATPPRQSLEVPSQLARSATRDSYQDAESVQNLPHSPRTRSKDRNRNKSFAAGIISSVNDLVRNEGHGRFRRRRETPIESKDVPTESPRHSIEGSEAEQSSGSHNRKSLDIRPKNGGVIGAQNEPPPPKVRPRLLERIELPTFRPSMSPSSSRPGTPDVSKSERRLLPAFRPLSRAGSFKTSKQSEAVVLDPLSQSQPLSPPQPTIPENHRPWPVHLTHHHSMNHGSSDLARLRALLLCSGIKASGIMDSLLAPQPPTEYLHRALTSTNSKDILDVPLASQPQTAASQLTSSLNATSLALHQNHASLPAHLTPVFSRLASLRATASALVDNARSVGDEAVNTTAILTGQKTIEIRKVIDAVDSFRRKRRRRLRWIRRVAFAGLEWGVLLIMWVVWAVVVIINIIWKGMRGAVRVVRWALWM